MLHRRSLFALPALATFPALAAEPADETRTELAGVAVPGLRARLLVRLRLGEAEAVVLAFAADLPEGVRDLFAVVGGGIVVALEPLSWRGEDGARISTRLSAVPDRTRLRLERSAVAPRGRGWRREDWTDYLAWNGAAPMRDAPVRPVLAGTWQDGFAALRAEMRGLLVIGPRAVAQSLVAACPAPHLIA